MYNFKYYIFFIEDRIKDGSNRSYYYRGSVIDDDKSDIDLSIYNKPKIKGKYGKRQYSRCLCYINLVASSLYDYDKFIDGTCSYIRVSKVLRRNATNIWISYKSETRIINSSSCWEEFQSLLKY